MVQLLTIETVLPQHYVTATETKTYLRSIFGGRARRFCEMVDSSRIQRRFCVAPAKELLRLGTLEARNSEHTRHALALSETVVRNAITKAAVAPESLTTMISVCSSGHMMPSLDTYLIDQLRLNRRARRIPVSELGCSAGVAAIGVASDILNRSGAGAALVVSVELSSLCLQVAEVSLADVLGAILFGDGAAAAVLTCGEDRGGLQILATGSFLWPDSRTLLGMRLTNTGLRPVISPNLPRVVRAQIGTTVRGFLRSSGLQVEDISFWVVHPGGPKILDGVGESLNLRHGALNASWAIWEQFGNLASATIFFILRHLQESAPPPAGGLGVMLAFGPGVSCEMVLLRSRGWGKRGH
jgi:alkylresorcinol/alkylpyrone synthase